MTGCKGLRTPVGKPISAPCLSHRLARVPAARCPAWGGGHRGASGAGADAFAPAAPAWPFPARRGPPLREARTRRRTGRPQAPPSSDRALTRPAGTWEREDSQGGDADRMGPRRPWRRRRRRGRGSHVKEQMEAAGADAQLRMHGGLAPHKHSPQGLREPGRGRRPHSTDGSNICLRTQTEWRRSRRWREPAGRPGAGGGREGPRRARGASQSEPSGPQAPGVLGSGALSRRALGDPGEGSRGALSSLEPCPAPPSASPWSGRGWGVGSGTTRDAWGLSGTGGQRPVQRPECVGSGSDSKPSFLASVGLGPSPRCLTLTGQPQVSWSTAGGQPGPRLGCHGTRH